MKKIALMAVLLMGLAVPSRSENLNRDEETGQYTTSPANFLDDSFGYAMSSIGIGYIDTFQHQDKQGGVLLDLPLMRYGMISMDSNFKFIDGLHEFGFSFPITSRLWKGFTVTPRFFNNFEAQELGFGVYANVKLR